VASITITGDLPTMSSHLRDYPSGLSVPDGTELWNRNSFDGMTTLFCFVHAMIVASGSLLQPPYPLRSGL
jgi:hypothetical protein